MTTVQVPRALRNRFRRWQVHRRQPFYEVIARALDALTIPAGGEEPP